MRRRKEIALVLAGVMLTSMLSACGDKGKDSNTGSDEGSAVKLTALISKHSLTKDVEDMEWLSELEKKCNVEIEWQQISADWDQKKSAMFASGNIPDIMFDTTSDADYVQYEGLFENLTPLIESDAPNIQTMFKEHPEIQTLAEQQNGEIYSIPSYKGVWPDSSVSMYINKEWLENVGKDVPQTWDELKDVLIAFRDEDANGNGDKTDEVPMDFNAEMWDFTVKVLLGSLGMQLSDGAGDGYFAEEATVKNFFIDERFKTLMVYLQDLYNEDLINKEVVTQGYSKCQSLARGEGDVAKVGFTFGWEAGDKFGNELAQQYVVVPQLKEHADSTADLKWINEKYAQNYVPNRVVMSAQCENKEAAMRFIDAFYKPEISMQVLFGGMNDTDKGIKDNGNGSYEVLPPADPSLDPGSWKWTNSLADNGPYYIQDELNLTLGTDMQVVLEEKGVYQELLDKIDPKTNQYPQIFMKYSKDDTNTIAINQANIKNITEQQWATWMTTTVDIEKEWDTYVKNANNAGLTETLEIRQKAYDEYLKSLK